MAAKPPGGGGVPPRAPTAPRAPQAPRVPQVPIAPPTPKVSVEEAAGLTRPRPPSTPDDWESTDVTRPHEMMLSRDDVRTIVQDELKEMRARFARIDERLQALERSQLTPVAPAVRSPPPVPVIAAPTPVVAPVAPAVVAPAVAVAPVAPVAPVVIAPTPPPLPVAAAAPVVVASPPPLPVAAAVADRTSDPFGSVVQAAPVKRPAAMDVDLSPDEILFDGSKRRRRITVVVLLLLLVTVGTFVGIAMTSQMRAGH